jgi:uncharacterized protein YecE (DUF72 family)
VNLLVGTSGYSYKEWVGSFYPEKQPAAGMLRFYGERFRTVEINNTFYRAPSAGMLQKWAGEVPETFRFVLKAPKRITHEKKLADVDDAVGYLLEVSKTLGEKRGPFLFQLPPFFGKDVPRLKDFLARLGAAPAALEFRHVSWFDDEVYDALRAHGAALCLAETDEGEAPFVATAPWGYLRLRREDYGDAELAAWVERVKSQAWETAYVFFKHEDEGQAPRLAARFLELAG